MTKKEITILIVEDHHITRLGLRIVLESIPGLVVVGEADNGTLALKKIFELAPDVTLLDIGLPQIDGIECLKRVKVLGGSSRIMIRSSHEEYAAVLAALAAGTDGYCLKDSTDELLVEGIKCLANGKAWLDPRIAGQLASYFAKNSSRNNSGIAQLIKPSLLNQEVALLTAIVNKTQFDQTYDTCQGLHETDLLRNLMKKMGAMGAPGPDA